MIVPMWWHSVEITCLIVCLPLKQLLELAKRACIYLAYKIKVCAKTNLSRYFCHSIKFSVCSLGGDLA